MERDATTQEGIRRTPVPPTWIIASGLVLAIIIVLVILAGLFLSEPTKTRSTDANVLPKATQPKVETASGIPATATTSPEFLSKVNQVFFVAANRNGERFVEVRGTQFDGSPYTAKDAYAIIAEFPFAQSLGVAPVKVIGNKAVVAVKSPARFGVYDFSTQRMNAYSSNATTTDGFVHDFLLVDANLYYLYGLNCNTYLAKCDLELRKIDTSTGNDSVVARHVTSRDIVGYDRERHELYLQYREGDGGEVWGGVQVYNAQNATFSTLKGSARYGPATFILEDRTRSKILGYFSYVDEFVNGDDRDEADSRDFVTVWNLRAGETRVDNGFGDEVGGQPPLSQLALDASSEGILNVVYATSLIE